MFLFVCGRRGWVRKGRSKKKAPMATTVLMGIVEREQENYEKRVFRGAEYCVHCERAGEKSADLRHARGFWKKACGLGPA